MRRIIFGYNDILWTHKTGYSAVLRIWNHLGLIVLTLTTWDSCPTHLKAPWEPKKQFDLSGTGMVSGLRPFWNLNKPLTHQCLGMCRCQHHQTPQKKPCDANSIKLPWVCHDFCGSSILHPSAPSHRLASATWQVENSRLLPGATSLSVEKKRHENWIKMDQGGSMVLQSPGQLVTEKAPDVGGILGIHDGESSRSVRFHMVLLLPNMAAWKRVWRTQQKVALISGPSHGK